MILEMTASALLAYGAVYSEGNSSTAQFIAQQRQSGLSRLQESLVLGLHGKGALNDLDLVYIECQNPGWDGYDALPLDETTHDFAHQFINALPLGTSLPAFGAEPDGHLTMEWHRSSRRTLSISISPTGELHYAALLGMNKSFGTEVFYGEAPKKIVDLIREVTAA